MSSRVRIPLLALLLTAPAWAQQPPPQVKAERSEDLDGDGAAERIFVDAGGTLRVVGAGAVEWGAVPPPPGTSIGAERTTLETVRAQGHVYLHARSPLPGPVKDRALEQIAIVDGKTARSVVSVVSGPQGPDADRSLVLRVDSEGVLRYQTAPRVARCDGYNVLFPELYDPETSKFRAVSIAPLAAPPGASSGATPGAPAGTASAGAAAGTAGSIAATTTLPEQVKTPPLGLFRFDAASTQRGDQRRAELIATPRELDDGRLDTAWYEGTAGSGRGAFVTARSPSGPQPLAGIAIATAPGNRIDSLSIVLGGGSGTPAPPLHAELGAAATPGRWVWIPLPGRTASCVTLALDGITRRGGGDETGLSEVRIYTTLDVPGAVARLIKQVEQGGAGDALLPILANHPREVSEALPTSAPPARRLLLRALAASAKAEAAVALVGALPTANADDRGFIAAALSQGTPLAAFAREPLARLMGTRSAPVAARLVALDLVARGPKGATSVWDHLSRGLLDDPALQEAAMRALGAAPPDEVVVLLATPAGTTAGGSAGSDQPMVTERVRILGAIAGRSRALRAPAVSQRATELLLPLAPAAAAAGERDSDEKFAARFRWLRAARQAGGPALLPVIERESHAGDESVRWAAVEAAAALEGGAGAAVVRAALVDRDPRVRAAAVEGLTPAGATPSPADIEAATRALRDRWPMVRRAAAERMALACPGKAADSLARAVADRTPAVEEAALSSLARCAPERAAPLALKIVTTLRAPIALREQAALLVVRLRPAGAAAPLSEALQDVLDLPGADERFAGLATSLTRALGKLGDPAGEPGLQRAANEPLLPGLRAIALDALASLCTPTAKQRIAAGASDEDPQVKRAAAAAAVRCR